jgi:hypothetical protein
MLIFCIIFLYPKNTNPNCKHLSLLKLINSSKKLRNFFLKLIPGHVAGDEDADDGDGDLGEPDVPLHDLRLTVRSVLNAAAYGAAQKVAASLQTNNYRISKAGS